MRINHRIVTRANDPFWRAIDKVGLSYERDSLIYVLNITEDAPAWPDVERLCEQYAPIQQIRNLFTPMEIADAAPFRLRAEFKARRSDFLQLNWIYDEFFVRRAPRRRLASDKSAELSFILPCSTRTTGRSIASCK